MCSERNASHASVTNKEFIFHISWPLSLTVKVKMCKVGTLRSTQWSHKFETKWLESSPDMWNHTQIHTYKCDTMCYFESCWVDKICISGVGHMVWPLQTLYVRSISVSLLLCTLCFCDIKVKWEKMKTCLHLQHLNSIMICLKIVYSLGTKRDTN